MNEMLILVDKTDMQTGALDKVSVHREGLLHRAFSIFIFNSNHELLLQQRADQKYHSGGLWTNTCCGHPRNEELTAVAVQRRLKEEMGLICDLSFQFNFIYKSQFENGLVEHELDHVYFGMSDSIPQPNPTEVKHWKYLDLERLNREVLQHPDKYTAWLKICLPKIMKLYVQEIGMGEIIIK